MKSKLDPRHKKRIHLFQELFAWESVKLTPKSVIKPIISQITDIDTRIDEVLHHRKGVCQDYAHLFIAICRKNKIPARYVSGYLNQGADFIGSSQMHAWVEALVPGLGWIGFDSTNNLLADHHYVKIAHGTDFRDCSPIVGILETSGMQRSIQSITITNQ